jgi:glyoxylase-like metal-dependent hydrolase (beta-lactamase superfamily II)
VKLGTTLIDIVCDGTFLLDGGSLFGQVPKALWELQMRPDRKNRVRLGLNCLLIRTPSQNILIDTGAGSKRADRLKDDYGVNGNKLIKQLKKLGLTPRDIDIVVLTHLHFDTAGGCTKLDRTGTAIPTFPKAEYIVQKASWDEANNPNERCQRSFHSDDYVPLQEAGVLTLLDGDTEIAPGVKTKVTNGHSEGHQIVLIEAGAERIAFLGELIPTPYHLPLASIAAFDQSPNDTLLQKRELIDMAIKGGWLLIFGHANDNRAGYVGQRNGKSEFTVKEF